VPLKISIHSAAILFFAVTSVYAADEIPARETAGAEQQRFEQESKMQKGVRDYKQTPHAETVAEETVPESEAAEKKFELKGVRVTGNQTIATAELEALAAEWINQQVNLTDLKKVASKIKSYYRDKKKIAAYVYVQPQKISNGMVEFVVIEGRIGTIQMEGNRWYSARVLKRAIHLPSGKVLYFSELQSALSYLNKQPDIKAQASLKPGAIKDTTDIVFKVKDKFPAHLNMDVNNLGTKNTGLTRWGVGVTHNNLLGQMDTFATRFQIGSGAWAIGTQYRIPVGPYRTNIGFSYSRSAVHLGGAFRDLNVRGAASTYGMEVIQPVKVLSYLESALTAGFDTKSIQNKILGQKAGTDELRILNMGVNLEESDSHGKTYFPHTFHVGFANFMGSNGIDDPSSSRTGTGGQFFIYRSTFIRYQRLPKGMLFTVRGNMQLTPDRVAPSEQFRLGGAFSVRGYSEGDYLADYGGLLTNELSVPTYFFPEDWKLPYSSEPLRQQVQAIGFFDFGGGALRHRLNGEDRSKFLAGLGGGVKLHLFDHIYGRAQWGGRIGDKAVDGARGAFYYGISAEIP